MMIIIASRNARYHTWISHSPICLPFAIIDILIISNITKQSGPLGLYPRRIDINFDPDLRIRFPSRVLLILSHKLYENMQDNLDKET